MAVLGLPVDQVEGAMKSPLEFTYSVPGQSGYGLELSTCRQYMGFNKMFSLAQARVWDTVIEARNQERMND